ncbi:MAG: histidine kinase [Bacteroidota bacterium]
MEQQSVAREIWVHIIVWICLILFPIALSINQFGFVDSGFFPRIFMNPLLVYVNYLILVPKLLLKRKIILYIVVSILFLALFNYVMNKAFLTMPLRRFQDFAAMDSMKAVKYAPYFMTFTFSFAFFLLGGVLALTKNFYKRDRITQTIRAQRNETELQFLRAQLNPHFLFNSLNSIYSMVRNKSNDAPDAIISLSELMRYMLYETREDVVPLAKEIDYIKNYVELQLYRLSDPENVKLHIKGDYTDKKIPPLLLIPFVENAFKYGTDFKGKTEVTIKMDVLGSSLFFEACNKINTYRKDKINSGIGLENIKTRLALLFPETHALNINKTKEKFVVQLELNL